MSKDLENVTSKEVNTKIRAVFILPARLFPENAVLMKTHHMTRCHWLLRVCFQLFRNGSALWLCSTSLFPAGKSG